MSLIGTTMRSPRGAFEIAILIDGLEQKLYRRQDGRIFVAGEQGAEYTLRVSNLTPTHLEVINTIDGRHTLDDEEGNFHMNHGLVFEPRHGGEIKGWRTSDKESRKFKFGSRESGVAVQATGSAENVGVIGFAAHIGYSRTPRRNAPVTLVEHRETKDGPAPTYSDRLQRQPMPSNSPGYPDSGNLSTGMGETQHDPIGRIPFERDTTTEPDILVIRYEPRDVLVAWGVITETREPNPFPGSSRPTGYAKFS